MAQNVERLSAANDYYQLTLALVENRKQRRRQRRFVVQGVQPITGALEHGWGFESLWVADKARLSGWARDVVARAGARRVVQVRPDLFSALGGKTEPGELVAVVDLPPNRLDDVAFASSPLLVVCDRPRSPGNLGSIVRSADALGADGVVVTGHAVDVYDPQTIRASLGALFAIPVEHVDSPSAAVAWLREHCPGLRLVGTSAKATASLDDFDFRKPVGLVLGNEKDGLSRWWIETCDDVLTIPAGGATSSLNLAAAATAFLNEIRRQRRAQP